MAENFLTAGFGFWGFPLRDAPGYRPEETGKGCKTERKTKLGRDKYIRFPNNGALCYSTVYL